MGLPKRPSFVLTNLEHPPQVLVRLKVMDGGFVTVRLVSSLTRQDLTIKRKIVLICML